jgi:hypothetical protein
VAVPPDVRGALGILIHQATSLDLTPPAATVTGLPTVNFCRRRWKFLAHLPLHGTFRLGEVTLLQPQLSQDDLAPFAEELANRDKRRKRRVEAARRESRREAAAAAAAQRARQGPSAAELLAMPRLGSAGEGGVASADAQGGDASGLTGLTPEQMEEALAAQVMHDTALGAGGSVLGASPPGGVSFAKMAKLGFAASGPALPSSSPAGATAQPGSGAAEFPSAVGAAGQGPGDSAALKGAWGATKSSGQSAAARLSSGSSSTSQKTGAGASSSSSAATLLGRSSWGASAGPSAAAGKGPGDGGSSSGTAAAAGAGGWLVLGGKDGGAGGAGGAAAAAAGGEGAGSGEGAGGAGSGGSSSSSSKKGKKGMVLFATGQRRY